jgi:hypothetical protein
MSSRGGEQAAPPGASPNGSSAARRDPPGLALADGPKAIAPDPAVTHWREPDGTRHSYRTLRCALEPEAVRGLGRAHVAAIQAIASAALAAVEGGDGREARRLAAAAGRLCGEIAGRWPPSAVEVPKR